MPRFFCQRTNAPVHRVGGAVALVDRSSAPQRCRNRTSGERVAEIERLRRQRLSGPAIARQLGIRPGVFILYKKESA